MALQRRAGLYLLYEERYNGATDGTAVRVTIKRLRLGKAYYALSMI